MDYSSLKLSIANWMVRSDLDTVVDDFIDFAEARLNRELRLRSMESSIESTITSGFIFVPIDYLELKHAYVNTSPIIPLERTTADKLYQEYPTRSASGRPSLIARDGAVFVFGPYPDSAYTIKGIYYAPIASLSGTNTTNWYTENEPDLLLAACCIEAARYVKDDQALSRFSLMYQDRKSAVEKREKREQLSGRGLSMRLS